MTNVIALIDKNIEMFKGYGPSQAHRVAEMEREKAQLLAYQRGELPISALPWAAQQWTLNLGPRDLQGT